MKRKKISENAKKKALKARNIIIVNKTKKIIE